MQLRQLEYLVALAREHHFARAANACHVSQPSLSAGIVTLERELGVPIVQRGHRFVGLTTEGEVVLRWAHRILAEREGLLQDLSALRGGLTGVLRIGAIPTALTAATMVSSSFCERHPHVRAVMESLSSREITRRMGEFELDAALTYLDEIEGTGLRALPLYEERYLLLTPEDGPLADRSSVRWAEVAAVPLCLLGPWMRNRRILHGIFREAGATVVPEIETDTVSALYAHVATQRWSSVIAHAWLHMFGVPAGMRVVRLENPPQFPQIGLVVADQRPQPPLAGALEGTARELDVRGELERVLHRYLDSP